MASALSSCDVQGDQLSSSTSSRSPLPTRPRHKTKVDPFNQFAVTPLSFELPVLPNDSVDEEPLLRKLVLTPLLFISFTFSLFFVNLQDRSRRRKEHSKLVSNLTYLCPSAWFSQEPYQDSTTSSWSRKDGTTHVEPHDAISPRGNSVWGKSRQKPWHLNKKIRKITMLQISDAFESQERFLFAMIAVMTCFFAVSGMCLWWLFLPISAYRLTSDMNAQEQVM